jgi:hypothetical protein
MIIRILSQKPQPVLTRQGSCNLFIRLLSEKRHGMLRCKCSTALRSEKATQRFSWAYGRLSYSQFTSFPVDSELINLAFSQFRTLCGYSFGLFKVPMDLWRSNVINLTTKSKCL